MSKQNKKIQFFTIDSFTAKPFEGNPAAVVFMDQDISDNLMQKIATEMNLSETAYLRPLHNTDSNPWSCCHKFSLRWMTPTNEVNLCGHATLASAHALFFEADNNNDVLEFETLSGTLKARKQKNKIVLDLPLLTPCPLNESQKIICDPLVREVTGLLKVQELAYSAAAKKLLVRLEDSHTREELEKMSVQIENLFKLHDGSLIKGIIVTLKVSRDYHFVSRYFAPWNGIPEDPVTGSAHSVLGPYWAKVLETTTLICRQCSARGGDLCLTITDDGRIDIAGDATTVFQGYIRT